MLMNNQETRRWTETNPAKINPETTGKKCIDIKSALILAQDKKKTHRTFVNEKWYNLCFICETITLRVIRIFDYKTKQYAHDDVVKA